MHRRHLLTPKALERKYDAYVFVDTETKQQQTAGGSLEHVFALSCVCIVDQKTRHEVFFICRTAHEFADVVHRTACRYHRTALFAHNLGFDLRVLNVSQTFAALGWRATDIHIGAKYHSLTITFTYKHHTLVCIDTMNFFDVSVQELGRHVGLPKLHIDFATASERKLITYCARDVEIIKRAVFALIDRLADDQLGSLQYSIAGQAFTAFRSRFMSHRIEIHAHEEVTALERESLVGGRVEAMHVGSVVGPIYKLDVNSMYAAMMYKFRFPRKLVGYYRQHIDTQTLLAERHRCYYIARVVLETARPRYPQRTRKGIEWPIGSFETVLCHASLCEAIERGEVQEIKEIAVYVSAPLFREYVDFFWKRRVDAMRRGDTTAAYLYKRFLVCLHGKFAQHKYVCQRIGHAEHERDESFVLLDHGLRALCFTFCGEHFLVYRSREESYHAFPAIAAAVMDYAHSYLWMLMCRAGIHNVYYCATDMLLVNRVGYQRLHRFIGSDLGQLKIERVARRLEVRKRHDYTLDDERVIAGVSTHATFDATRQVYRSHVFESFTHAARSGVFDRVRAFLREQQV